MLRVVQATNDGDANKMTTQPLGRLMAALALCTLFGCNLADDAANDDTKNPTAKACTGADPSIPLCVSDADCAAGEQCLAVAGECQSSACSCDTTTGTWTCTADCGERKACQASVVECQGPSPAASTPENSSDCDAVGDSCADGKVCAILPDRCGPSSACWCDTTNGTWMCNQDCPPVLRCEEPACAAPDPSVDGCSTDADCGADELCAARVDDACRPSSCMCDAVTGEWACTEDCGQYHECAAKPACAGPDPSADGCAADADCGPSEICAVSADASCRPSACMCDAVTGEWSCTDDCNPHHACIVSACTTPNPADQHGCDTDMDCGVDEACVVVDANTCVSDGCFCDENSGSWTCNRNCSPKRGCESTACTTPNPALPACSTDADCGRRETCEQVPGCTPSACSCDAQTGMWTCTKDCLTSFACQPTFANLCLDPNPSQDECAVDADCQLGQSCQVMRGCRPSACTCDVSGQWTCTADCVMPRACL
jgi:hypothetical protein